MLEILSNETEDSMEGNKKCAESIFEMSKEDPYFAECKLVVENVQTMGYLRYIRSCFEHIRETMEAVTGLRLSYHNTTLCFLVSWSHESWISIHSIHSTHSTHSTPLTPCNFSHKIQKAPEP